jgi:nucleotide-binding universal stress UspA family protein
MRRSDMTTKPVVVAVDGSEESLRAAEWAALEARRQSRPLRIVASRAACPVVVVREESVAVHREIAVGIRDPQDTGEAVAFAFEEAALRGADLVAVHTWYWIPAAPRVARASEAPSPRPDDPARISAEAGRQLAAVLDHAHGPVAIIPAGNLTKEMS